jgi:hypothetical protein
LRAQSVHQHAARDAEQPSSPLRAVTQPTDAPDDTQPDLLGDLLSHVVVRRQLPDIAPERCVPALDQRIERRSLSELAAHDEPLVLACTILDVRVLCHIPLRIRHLIVGGRV